MPQVNFVGVVDIFITILSFELLSNLHIFSSPCSSSSLSRLPWACLFLVYLLNIAAIASPVNSPVSSHDPISIIEEANQVSATYTEVKLWVIRDKASRKTMKAYIYIGDQGFGLGNVPPLSDSVPPKRKFNIGKPPQDPTELLGPAFFANGQDRDRTLDELRTLNQNYGKIEERYYAFLTEILRLLAWHQTGLLDPMFAFDDELLQKWNDRVDKIVKKINEKKEKKRKDAQAQGKSN
ncbi:hypothetical protein C8R41DRAFT_865596 [Lentinula lateritia]|uniref:Uncharacterized protein n=1 Tax=Lentinula lateritia TaxID=40482 RepID=A0ABQ8VNW6_9AGAR|nr:hypothetical protein C8R41DRAFT_865596 [Lentinula lateritia]